MERVERDLDSIDINVEAKDISFDTTISYLSNAADTGTNYLKTTESAKEWTRHNPNSSLFLIKCRYTNLINRYTWISEFPEIRKLEYLIKNGANINKMDKKRQTPISYATKKAEA